MDFLISTEERFRNYKNDLFSYQSKELDRELVGQEENKRINVSISSYLRLLSGYLELHSALKTLEYLIRRYKYALCFSMGIILLRGKLAFWLVSLGAIDFFFNILYCLFLYCRVHVYNAEDLILCALPYHDTHVFVQIVQLINTGYVHRLIFVPSDFLFI